MEKSLVDNDSLGWKSDKSILIEVKDEIILLTDTIIKINRFNMSQSRYIMVTNKAVYNYQKKKLKRRIEMENILGITISKQTDEFVIHGIGGEAEYDYYYVYSKKKKLIESIAKPFKAAMNRDLILCELDQKSLKGIVTTKKQKKKDANFTMMPVEFKIDLNLYLNPPVFTIQNPNDNQLKMPIQNKTREGRASTIYTKRNKYNEVYLEDFKILKVIGRGSFGKVYLVDFVKTGEFFAMKSLKKDVLLDQDQIENTLLEKQILQSLDHPFLCSLEFCFQTEDRIYFVMPFLNGGELFQHLKNMKYFTEEKVRFYGSQIALALDNLHKYGIIYRDLKPENILIDKEGYLKLADFGMAKLLKNDEKATSFCGTPEYLAPEIILESGHNKACDWWSFGILLYEMLCGIPPFYNENLEKMYDMIKFSDLKFPKRIKLSDEAQDIIIQLLQKEPDKRLGHKGGMSDIQQHPFFCIINMEDILNKRLPAPFKPEINDSSDVSNFDKEFIEEDISQSFIPQKNIEIIKKNQDKFKDF